MTNNQKIDPHYLNVYITYTNLTSTSLGYILSSWGKIADFISKSYSDNFNIKYIILPTLEIESVHTGNSIKFSFGEGWLPNITSDKNNDIIINVPKKLGIPLLTGYLMLNTATKVLDIHNKYLDNRIKQLEIVLKETEIEKLNREKPDLFKEMSHNTSNINTFIIENKEFKTFIIYDIDIKNLEKYNENYKNEK